MVSYRFSVFVNLLNYTVLAESSTLLIKTEYIFDQKDLFPYFFVYSREKQ